MFKDYFLNRQLKRLEREGNDDLMQVLELGPEPFPTPELKLFIHRIRSQAREVIYLKKRLFLAGLFSVLLCGLSFLFGAAGWPTGAAVLLALAPIGIIVFITGNIFIARRFRTFRHTRMLERAIREEIDRRHKDASIF